MPGQHAESSSPQSCATVQWLVRRRKVAGRAGRQRSSSKAATLASAGRQHRGSKGSGVHSLPPARDRSAELCCHCRPRLYCKRGLGRCTLAVPQYLQVKMRGPWPLVEGSPTVLKGGAALAAPSAGGGGCHGCRRPDTANPGSQARLRPATRSTLRPARHSPSG